MFILVLAAATLGADLTVGPGGFKTVAEGTAALQPGDVLTIMPGEYREAITATLKGTESAPITLRAWRPGSVLLRGDVDLTDFTPAPGLRHTYVTTVPQKVEAVFERSTFRTLEPKLTPAEVESTLTSYHHDARTGQLFIHTSDSQPPTAHALGASVTNANGLLLIGSQHVIVDGLSVTGFSHRDYGPQHGSRTRWGIMLKDCQHCTVRRCTTYLNSGGIHFLGGGQDCVAEDCGDHCVSHSRPAPAWSRTS